MNDPSVDYAALLAENAGLKKRVQELEAKHAHIVAPLPSPEDASISRFTPFHSLNRSQIARYGRQLILPEVGVEGQSRLRDARVLVVGAGGLGAPVCLYLAAAGIGHLGIIDPDHVEMDNLHRQVIHSESTVGQFKAVSARDACLRLNSSIKCEAYLERFAAANALKLTEQYDILVDASDNVPTRYLVNDAAVLCRKPVVSGSALRLEGQITVYAHAGGPCYRCMYPQPPPPATVANCGDAGVLGAITGVIGSLQALEVIKIAGKMKAEVMSGKMLHFDGETNRFLTIKLRPRNPNCAVCGDNPTIRAPINYEEFCGTAMHDKPAVAVADAVADAVAGAAACTAQELSPAIVLPPFVKLPDVSSISAREFARRQLAGAPFVLLDVREAAQFRICSLPGSINIPYRELESRLSEVRRLRLPSAAVHVESSLDVPPAVPQCHGDADSHVFVSDGVELPLLPIYVVCRRGIDSVRATNWLLQSLPIHDTPAASSDSPVLNVAGGLLSWTRFVDPTFPVY